MTLVHETGIPMSHMARALSYDPSYLSKICSGQRFPSSPTLFIDNLCQFVAEHFVTEKEQKGLARTLGFEFVPAEDLSFADALKNWFSSEEE